VYGPPLSRVWWAWEEEPSSPSLVHWVNGFVMGEARGLGALRRTALARERAMGRDCVRRVGDVPIGGRQGPEAGLGLGGCRDEPQGIWQPLVL
jgi:hypothetical protein